MEGGLGTAVPCSLAKRPPCPVTLPLGCLRGAGLIHTGQGQLPAPALFPHATFRQRLHRQMGKPIFPHSN